MINQWIPTNTWPYPKPNLPTPPKGLAGRLSGGDSQAGRCRLVAVQTEREVQGCRRMTKAIKVLAIAWLLGSAGCTTMQEALCLGQSDADFIANGTEICYKPSYVPTAAALAAAKEALPDRVKVQANDATYKALVNRHCPVLCKRPDLDKCPKVIQLTGIEVEDGKSKLETEEIPDPKCVERNNAVQELARVRCDECTRTKVVEICLNEFGDVLPKCVRSGDPLSKLELEASLDRQTRALESMYQRMIDR